MIRRELVTGLLLRGKPVIFSVMLILACHQNKQGSERTISIIWKDGHATGISISAAALQEMPPDEFNKKVTIRLSPANPPAAIAGDHSVRDGKYIFEPLIPFTRGLSYRVFLQNDLLDSFTIPADTVHPELVAIYPSADTVPENLLKIYLLFSAPMEEGHSVEHIHLIGEKGDTLANTFLDLHHELWDERNILLTVWLNPGRIKRGLQPNESMGAPLQKEKRYRLLIDSSWRDQNGRSLGKNYFNRLVTTARDETSPSVDTWQLSLPAAGTLQSLSIDFGEPLDFSLLQNTISIADSSGRKINGAIEIGRDERAYLFKPEQLWKAGAYQLLVESRLEDLAGNNLNRLFDEDLKKTHSATTKKDLVQRRFIIRSQPVTMQP